GTAALNAYVGPLMARHLRALAAVVPGRRLRVMQSGGGLIGAPVACAEPVRTILSGPAGGVVGAAGRARRAGHRRVITLDMGGTSADVSLVDGALAYRSETSVDGLPVRVPALDIHTVGAGGGSLARLDRGGALRVGPESAGADPGPACYGRGSAARRRAGRGARHPPRLRAASAGAPLGLGSARGRGGAGPWPDAARGGARGRAGEGLSRPRAGRRARSQARGGTSRDGRAAPRGALRGAGLRGVGALPGRLGARLPSCARAALRARRPAPPGGGGDA